MNWETADYLKVVVEYNVCNKDVIPPCEPLCFLSFLPPPPSLPPPSLLPPQTAQTGTSHIILPIHVYKHCLGRYLRKPMALFWLQGQIVDKPTAFCAWDFTRAGIPYIWNIDRIDLWYLWAIECAIRRRALSYPLTCPRNMVDSQKPLPRFISYLPLVVLLDNLSLVVLLDNYEDNTFLLIFKNM